MNQQIYKRKFCWFDLTLLRLWRLITWTQICTSLNHRNVVKTECNRVIPWKLAASPQLSLN